jgi:protein-disulfide isomerase
MAVKKAKKAHYSKQPIRQEIQLLLVIGVVAVIIAGILIISSITRVGKIIKPESVERLNVSENHMGNPQAKVMVEEFADFQCPGCKNYWQEVEPDVLEQYINTGNIYYTYEPMYFLGQESFNSLRAAFCAMDQGKFWEYRDYIFANQNGENIGDFTDERLEAFAKRLNLDMNLFNACYVSEDTIQRAVDANQYATNKGVHSTPTIVINGNIINQEEIFNQIDALLNEGK